MVRLGPLSGDDDVVVRLVGRRRAKARSQSPYRAAAYWFRRMCKALKIWIRGDYKSKTMLTDEILLCAWEACHQIDPQNFPVRATSEQLMSIIAHRVDIRQTVAELHHSGRALPLDDVERRIEDYNDSFPSDTEPAMSDQLDELEQRYEDTEGWVQRR
jgi:hypothetical protein